MFKRFMGKIYNDITETIGHTPLVKINKLTQGLNVDILVKLESFNPFSSIKDRIGFAMIKYAEEKGFINNDTTIIEPTSGNTGIGLAFVCAVKGYKLILTMPETMSIERKRILEVLGAKIVLTDGTKGMSGSIEKAFEIARITPNSYIPHQFENPSNPEVHRKTTAQEIWNDTEGKIDIFVAGVGTGGTITGVGEVLKQKNRFLKIVAVEPIDSAVLSGETPGKHNIQGIGAGFIPKVLNKNIIDEIIKVKYEDCVETCERLAKKEGIFAGISSGAAMWASIEIAKREESARKTIVAILPDCGERYLSTI